MSQSINCSDIAGSKIQRAFAVLEAVKGRFAYPTSDHVIAISNDATANQTPEYTDSEEKLGTRDTLQRFRNAMPAATADIAMYLSTGATGEKPQGYDMLVSLFGTSTLLNPPVFTLGAADADAVTIPVAVTGGSPALPACGVITANGEQIYYDSLSADGTQLLNCKRGYNGTTPYAIVADTAGAYTSVAFRQDNCNPSFSLWLQTDHFLQGITGCTVNDATLSLSNESAVSLECSIQGLRLVVAGTSKTTALVSAGETVIPVEHSMMYSPGAVIWCPSVGDQGAAESGYIVASVDDKAGTITLAAPIEEDWPSGATVSGWLPQDAPHIGEPIEGTNTDVYMDGVRGKMRTSSLTWNNNITVITDELGTEYPEEYVGDARTIEVGINTYFRKEDGIRFREGLEGRFVPVRFAFGHGKAVWDMPRVQMTSPAVSIQSPTVSLDSTGTALITGKGNNAAELIIN